MNRSWILLTIIAILVILCVCCLCLIAALSASTLMIWNVQTSSGPETLLLTPLITIVTATPAAEASATPVARDTATPLATHLPSATQTPQPTANLQPSPLPPPALSGASQETLKILSEAEVPINDPADLARRLEGKTDIPPTLEPPPAPRQVGEEQSFWVVNSDTNVDFQVQATLRYVTDHAYFWIENGVAYSQGDLRRLAQAFENKIYPTDREFFGSEWSPGVDGDVHLYILYTSGAGSGIAGFFSTIDSYNPLIKKHSNGHEMFVLNADGTSLNNEYTYAVLAHEFQHMIHWYRDRNEETWVNEGFSDVAMLLNGYSIGGHDFVYAQDPDVQLNDWPNDSSATIPHYGASFLFLDYFLNRFGEQATKTLVADPNNGLVSIDKVLSELKISDPLTGKTVGADDVFTDWVLASYIKDKNVGDGRFTYNNYPDAPQPSETENVRTCSSNPGQRQVSQYGVDYIRIRCRGDFTLHFEGATQVNVFPENAYSGAYAFWSNKGDESDITLTHEFDFTSQSGPLTLQYWTWYDIEKDYDYLYLEASTDGVNWEILKTPSGTDTDPVGANYGWGYTGLSGGGPKWVQEDVDISKFAGKKVQLRFEYITDAGVNGEGFLLDNVAIPQTGYSTDFESDDGGWTAQGFVRVQNALPQTFRLALIKYGRDTTVEYIPLSADNIADIPLTFGNGMDEAVLVVAGTTRFTRQTASYQFSFSP